MSDIPINLTSDLTPDEHYLWDATGTPAQSTLAIETALSKLRHSGKPLIIPVAPRLSLRRWPILALAAAVLIAVSLAIYFLASIHVTPKAGWTVTTNSGNPTIVAVQGKTGPAGTQVTTDAASSATLQFNQGARVKLSPSSDATVTDTPTIELATGQANIEIPTTVPAATVTTPAVTCTLAPGCSASIESANGAIQVRVDSGWAEVSSGNESLRLADSMACATQPKSATIWPPYRISKDTSSNALIKQIDNILYGKNDEKTQNTLLQVVLKAAKPQDAALLWNLLPRLNESQRQPVRDRLAKLVKNPPQGPAFDAVLILDKDALDVWWNAIVGR